MLSGQPVGCAVAEPAQARRGPFERSL